ncbi:MAG: TIGR03087 family PEP-CTERM/XrtA system glycosyltransferase [Blastocatellales bacterium]
MKLLFLAHRIPFPPDKGDKIRSYHELRALVERGHEVHLLAFADDLRDLNYQVDLARLCSQVQIVPLRKAPARLRAMSGLIGSQPLTLAYFRTLKMKRLVKRALAEHNYDAVFVYSSGMAQYIPPEWRSRTVVDLVDVDSEKWFEYAERSSALKAWLYRTEGKRLRKYEYKIVAGFANSMLTTEREAALLGEADEFTRRARLRIMTNGVDLDQFHPLETGSLIEPTTRWANPRLVFTGAMDYRANVEAVEWFVREVFPLIKHREPRAEFFIVGSNPVSEVKKLAEHPGVTVTGFVEEIPPYLHEATVCVVPLQIARGVQNKLLEAMACGKAVVATLEAASAFRVTNDEQLLIAASATEFAEAVVQAIRDEALRKRLGWNARRFVELEHDWQPLLQRFVELVESAGQRRIETESRNVRAIARH